MKPIMLRGYLALTDDRLKQITVKVTVKAFSPPGQRVIQYSITCSNSTNPPCESSHGKAIEVRVVGRM